MNPASKLTGYTDPETTPHPPGPADAPYRT
jgi:hypothetical protein